MLQLLSPQHTLDEHAHARTAVANRHSVLQDAQSPPSWASKPNSAGFTFWHPLRSFRKHLVFDSSDDAGPLPHTDIHC